MKVIHQSLRLSLLLALLTVPVAAQSTFGDLPEGDPQTCEQDGDCPLINCFIAPCPAAVCRDGVCGIEDDPPNPECVQDSDCPVINCFAAPCDVNVCNGGLCELQPPPEEEPDNLVTPEGIPCGPSVCTGGEPCCNESCGICGQICSEQFCLDEEEDGETETGIPCGPSVCTGGEPCCNESCGICGQICTEQFCLDETSTVAPATNDTMMCTTDGDCPSLECFVAPCDQYVCNTTAGECIVGEMNDMPCGVNITCNETVLLNASVAADGMSATDGEETIDKTSNGDMNGGTSTNSAESKSSRQFIVLESIVAVMAATSLLVFL